MSGISEVDIRDWLKRCDEVEHEMDHFDPAPWPAYNFVEEVRAYFQSQQKQVAALFKP